VINLTRALAAEWGPKGIRVNAIAPGYFPTKMSATIIAAYEQDLVDNTPLGKLGGDTDMMGAALLLCSAAGGHITGQVLTIDGGFTII
jgi:gluconate 5-dehydrogenase